MARRIKFRMTLIVVLATALVVAATVARAAPPARAEAPCEADDVRAALICTSAGRVVQLSGR